MSFVDSLFTMFKLRKKIDKVKEEIIGFDNVRAYNHNFRDYIFYKSMDFRSKFLENLAAEKNKAWNIDARAKAVKYYLETLFLQYILFVFFYFFLIHLSLIAKSIWNWSLANVISNCLNGYRSLANAILKKSGVS